MSDNPRLFHVSDLADIALFEPRPVRAGHPHQGLPPVVWAVGERLLHNYLLPRDCPRVTFYATPDSDPADVARLLGVTAAGHVIAIESGWLGRLRATTLWLYELPPDTFDLLDSIAAYYVSRQPVRPLTVRRVDDLLGELARRDVELRVTPTLWPLRDAVLASSLAFSFIQMGNARPRTEEWHADDADWANLRG
jgi:hypothetical protein